MSDPLRPRRVAASILGRVLRVGAYSNVLLDAQNSTADSREIARIKALVYGSLRALPDLDRRIAEGSDRPIARIESELLDILRIAAFEIRNSNVPDAVAVSVGVDLVRERRPKAAGLANAILRRVAESTSPGPEGLEIPEWLKDNLASIWGKDQIEAFARASAEEPQRVGRLRAGRSSRMTPFPTVPGAYLLPPGAVREDVVVQDAASIAVGNAVRARPGMRVLDVAAAPGGKTLHIVDQVGLEGSVIASDSHLRRVRAAAIRVPGASWVCADGVRPAFASGRFDRVLIDAPCSGLGTLRRRPEILYRVEPADIQSLAVLQRRIVEASLPLLDAGGELVFSVCTVTPDETVKVIAGLGFEPPDGPGDVIGEGRMMSPHTTGTDGMFFARYRN